MQSFWLNGLGSFDVDGSLRPRFEGCYAIDGIYDIVSHTDVYLTTFLWLDIPRCISPLNSRPDVKAIGKRTPRPVFSMTSFKKAADNQNVIPGGDLDVERMPAYLLFARLGKRILRPGGRRMTRDLITGLNVTELDDVVEFAPGVGATASQLLARHPRNYVGVERDRECANIAARALARCSAASIRVGQA